MSYGTGMLWKAAAALLFALVVSLSTLGVAQATHQLSSPKEGWYEVGGSAADRMLSKSNNGAVVATWTHVKVNKDYYGWRAYWTIENTSNKPQSGVGCGGYQKYGLGGYKARVEDPGHPGVRVWHAKDALCVKLGGDYRQTLQPGQTITSWAEFDSVAKKGLCIALTLPTGPDIPEHVGYTKCVDPYAIYVGNGRIRSPFDSSQTWYVCRGYNTESHRGNSAYALDLIVDRPATVGPRGCTSDNVNASSGQPVYAPVPGRTSACWGSSGVNAQFVCVQSSSPTSNGYYFIIGHVDPDSRLLNTHVPAGREIGRLAPADRLNGGIAHLHIETRPELGTQSVPFTFANGTGICQQDFPSNGTQGQYAGEAVRGCR